MAAIASLATFCSAGVGVTLVAGWPEADPSDAPGVPREVDTATSVPSETAAPDDDELAMPPYLMSHSPGHLDSETAGSTTSPPQTNTRASAPTTASAPTSTTTTTTTVAVGTSPTTTTTTTTTPTLPGKKSDEPDGSPQAIDDTYFIAADQIVPLYVLENDSDPDGNLSDATLSLVSGPANAQRFTLAGDYFRYRSYPSTSGKFSAEDSFVYELCDQDGNCDTATVSLFIEVG